MTIQAMPIQHSISQQVLVTLIGQLINGRPSDDDSRPPGVLGPIVRRTVEKTLWVLGPPQPQPWIQVALNPQPLPPRTLFFAAIAQEVIERASLIQETADALISQGERQGIIIVGGYVSRFADDFELCPRIPWPFPGPRPHWFPEAPDGVDLIVTGVQFQRAASETFDGQMRQTFADAGTKLVQAGAAKLQ